MKILINHHNHYNYLDSTIIQGLQNLGHEVMSGSPHRTNYVTKTSAGNENFDLFIEFHRDGSPWPGLKSVLCWGEDDHRGLKDVFNKGFDHVFVRDIIPGEVAHAMNFGIETRYYCITDNGYKPLKDRSIDICFLGGLQGYKGNRLAFIERLKKDFSHLNLMLGTRRFNTPDDEWSAWTLPWSAHDPRYFETLADSKIVLSFKGAGPDTGRFWECLASGGVVVSESLGIVEMVRPTPGGVKWFVSYDQLRETINDILSNLDRYQETQAEHWQWNRKHHSTTARAKHLLNAIGM